MTAKGGQRWGWRGLGDGSEETTKRPWVEWWVSGKARRRRGGAERRQPHPSKSHTDRRKDGERLGDGIRGEG